MATEHTELGLQHNRGLEKGSFKKGAGTNSRDDPSGLGTIGC